MNSKKQEELFNEFSEEQRKTLIKKRSDYATEDVLSNFIQTANITGTSPAQVALILIGIKVARLGNLISNNKTNVNESMEDSVLDLANYAFLLKCILVDNNDSEKETSKSQVKKYVRCIDNTLVKNISVDKIYEVIDDYGKTYDIINNNGEEVNYYKHRFTEVTDISKLKDLQKIKGRLDKR